MATLRGQVLLLLGQKLLNKIQILKEVKQKEKNIIVGEDFCLKTLTFSSH